MSAPSVRALFVVGESTLSKARQIVKTTLSQWAQAWGVSATAAEQLLDGVKVSVHELAGQQAEGVLAQHGDVWSCRGSEAHRRLANAVMGRAESLPVTSGDWALRAAEAAWLDLCHRMANASTSQEATAVGTSSSHVECWPQAQHHDGYLLALVPSLDACWLLPAQAHAAAPAAPASSKPMALSSVLGQARVTLRATLGSVEVSLRDLQALEPGDVVCFPASTRGGACLISPTGNLSVAQATVGRMQNLRALEIIDSARNV